MTNWTMPRDLLYMASKTLYNISMVYFMKGWSQSLDTSQDMLLSLLLSLWYLMFLWYKYDAFINSRSQQMVLAHHLHFLIQVTR